MLVSGTVFAQAITILLSPLITRIYSPQEYGVLTVYVAILGMISLLGSLSYESAIPIVRNEKYAFNLLLACLCVLSIVSIILSLLILTTGDFLLILFNAEDIIAYKFFIPIGFFFTGLYTILSQWSLRKKNFKSLTITKYNQSIVGNFTKIGLGITKFTSIGLIVGTILSQSAGVITLTKPYIYEFKSLITTVKFKKMLMLLYRYKKFPFYTAPGILILSISTQLPVVFVSSLYGSSIVGLYGLARSITFLPMGIVGKSVQDVFYSEVASLRKSNPLKIKELSNKILKKLIFLGVFPVVVLVFWGPELFSLVFGSNWENAGVFASILSIELFFHFIFQPISVVFSIFEKQQKMFILYSIRLLIMLVIFLLSKTLNLSPYETVLLLSIFMALVEWMKYLLAQKIIKNEIYN